MLFNKSAILAAVCAALVPSASAFTVAYSAYPNSTLGAPTACTVTPSSTGTFNTGTTGAPGCHALTPAAFFGRFTLQSTAPPAGCVVHTFSGTGCTGTEGPTVPLTLLPGVQSACTRITPVRLVPLPVTTLPAASVQVVCPPA